jgi:hypothetical protein
MPFMRAAIPTLTEAEVDDMEYVDWVVYQQIAAVWRQRWFGGE